MVPSEEAEAPPPEDKVEEKEPVIKTISVRPLEITEVSTPEEKVEDNEPIVPAPSVAPSETVEAPAPEEKVEDNEPIVPAPSVAPSETVEAPAPEEKVADNEPVTPASSVLPPEAVEAPATESEGTVEQDISVTPSETAEAPVSEEKIEEKEPVTRAFTMVPSEATEAAPPEEKVEGKDPAKQALVIRPLEITGASAPGPEEPIKYQRVLTSGGWQLPPITILDKPAEMELSQSEIEKRAKLIEEAINSYGVEAKVVQINVGPTVTQFGVEPGWDRKYKKIRERDQDGNVRMRLEEVSKTRVKVDRISALASDLALALAAPSIRIEAPVPGKSIVGIEVPNTTFGLVNLRSVIESTSFQKAHAKSKLALALGKGAGGETVAADLDKMPHLLIAGATGSGKTACLNSIICCLLIHNTPDDVQWIMIDPKRVELVNFNSLPHLVAPVVVDTDKAILALRWLNQEMDNRYYKFAQVGARNIEGYNKNRQHGETMPYIVLVIDELADLMMAAFDEVERTLCRLAQLARATGIHLDCGHPASIG